MESRLRQGGFTLIELLTVIAIIAILAGMIMAVGPGMIERGKLTNLTSTFRQINNANVAFFTSHYESYPPAYGYIVKGTGPSEGEEDSEAEKPLAFHLTPYVQAIGLFRNMDMYDLFAESHDTDLDGSISLLEFSPMGTLNGPDSYTFSDQLYSGNNLDGEVSQQMEAKRPLVYIPVNSKQAQIVAKYYYAMGGQAGWYARRWAPEPDSDMAKLTFPPPKYDDYVLISVGPAGSTGGILTPPDSFMNDLASNVDPKDFYHVLALRAFFLATRDMNDNDLLDFNYVDRTRSGEGKEGAYPEPDMYQLPDGTAGKGPVIYKNPGR